MFIGDLMARQLIPLGALPDFQIQSLTEKWTSLVDTSLPELMAQARTIRRAQTGNRVTYSPKVFIPLTMLCRD